MSHPVETRTPVEGDLDFNGMRLTVQGALADLVAAASATFDPMLIAGGTATWSTPTNVTTSTGVNTMTIGQVTHTAAGTMAITTASSLAILGPPLASGSLTITTPFALHVHAGASRFDGQVLVAPGTATNPSIAFWGELGGAIGYDTTTGWHPDTGFFSLGDAGFGGNLIGVATAGFESTRFTPDGLQTFALQANYLFGGAPTYTSGIPSGRTDASPLTIVGGALTTSRGLTVRTSNLFNATSGTQSGTFFNYTGGGSGFAPTSGTAAFRGVELQYEVNQTGGANGQITGLYVKGTNTATASFAGHDALWVGNETTAVLRARGLFDGSTAVLLGEAGTGITAWSRLEFNTNVRQGQIYFFNNSPWFLINPPSGGSVAFGGNSFADGQGSIGEFSTSTGMRSTFGIFVETPAGGGGTLTYSIAKQAMKLDTASTISSTGGVPTWDHVHIAPLTATITGSTAITTAAGLNMMTVTAAALSGSMAIAASATLKISGDPTISGGGSITMPLALWLGGGHIRTDGFGSTGLIKNNNAAAWSIAAPGTDYVVSVSAGSGVSVTGAGGVLTVSATGTTLTAGTGITFVGGTAVTSNLSTGKGGGQVAIGGTGASETLTLQSTAHATRGAVTVDASQFLVPGGTSGAPMYSFLGDFDTGMYQVGAGEMGFTSNGVPLFTVGPTYAWSIRSLLVGDVFAFQQGTTPAILGEAFRVDGSDRPDSRITLAPGSGNNFSNLTQIADGQFTTMPPGLLNVAPNSLLITSGTTGNTYAGTLFSQPTVVAQSGTGNPVILNPFATVVIAGPPVRSNGTGTWGTWNPSDSLYVMSGRTVLNDALLVGLDAGYVFRAAMNSGSPAIGFFNSNHTQITVSGSRSGGTALTNLLSALNLYGLIVDSTTA